MTTAAIGISSTTPARSRSLTIMTSRWSQRSTRVPATGPNRRFGSVATRKTPPTAIGELVARRMRNASATWWTRSPRSEISWPVQSAENDESSASRTYGWRWTRSRIRGRPGMKGRAGGEKMPSLPSDDPPRLRGRSRADALTRPLASEIPATATPAAGAGARRPRSAKRRAIAAVPAAWSSAADRTVDANRKNARPAARNTSPMLATFRRPGTGIGRMSPSGPAAARKSLGIPPPALTPTIRWNADPTSVSGRPAARMLGCQTGM